MNTLPKICLNMIVKDEAHILEKRLSSLCEKIKIDYYVICDTGSSDNTKEIITTFFEKQNIKGDLYDHEWKNFGYNRTKALECAFEKSEYVFIFDADDEIIGNLVLPEEWHYDKYNLKFGDDFIYYRPLLINNKLKWCFKGVLHEYLDSVEDNVSEVNIEGDYHIFSGKNGSRNKDPEKYIKDAVILKEAFENEHETNIIMASRYAFYCAQSYKDAEHFDDAIVWYEKTLLLPCWIQEKYYSCIVIASIYRDKQDYIKALEYMLKSINYDEERIEGVTMACEYCMNANLHVVVNMLYEKFKHVCLPNNKLFLIRDCYNDNLIYYNSISCYYLAKYQEGYECIKTILKNNVLKETLMNQTVKNALFYKEQINNDESMELLQSLTKILKNKKLENKEILSEYTELLDFLKKRYFDF